MRRAVYILADWVLLCVGVGVAVNIAYRGAAKLIGAMR